METGLSTEMKSAQRHPAGYCWTDVGIYDLIVFSLKATVALAVSSLIVGAAGGFIVLLVEGLAR